MRLSEFIHSNALAEGDIVSFPGNNRPTDSIAVARGGASVHRIPVSRKSLDAFTKAYVTTALWASSDDDGDPLDGEYGPQDIHTDTLKDMARDCQRFRIRCADLLDRAEAQYGYTEEQGGHDFWLTRNRHAVGFFDRKLGDLGEALTKAAHAFGEYDLFVSDGVVHGDQTGREQVL